MSAAFFLYMYVAFRGIAAKEKRVNYFTLRKSCTAEGEGGKTSSRTMIIRRFDENYVFFRNITELIMKY